MNSRLSRSFRENQKLLTGNRHYPHPDSVSSEEDNTILPNECSISKDSDTWSVCTDRTLTCSWDEDYNNETSEEVKRMLDNIEEYLHEDADVTDSFDDDLIEECNAWKERFPHLRVLGHTIKASPLENEGTQSQEEAGKQKMFFLEKEEASFEFNLWTEKAEEIKYQVIDRLCELFWPEVVQWTDLNKRYNKEQEKAMTLSRSRQNFLPEDSILDPLSSNLEDVLTVSQKNLEERPKSRGYLDRASKTRLMSRIVSPLDPAPDSNFPPGMNNTAARLRKPVNLRHEPNTPRSLSPIIANTSLQYFSLPPLITRASSNSLTKIGQVSPGGKGKLGQEKESSMSRNRLVSLDASSRVSSAYTSDESDVLNSKLPPINFQSPMRLDGQRMIGSSRPQLMPKSASSHFRLFRE